jgi:hypothetical protein
MGIIMYNDSSDSNSDLLPKKRYSTKETAQIAVYGRSGKINCQMGNISKTGAFFEIVTSNFMPRQGDLVRITIFLKQLNKVRTVDGEVVWCRGKGMGLMFLKKDELFTKLSARPSSTKQT